MGEERNKSDGDDTAPSRASSLDLASIPRSTPPATASDSSPPRKAAVDPLLGTTVAGRFKILALVARGGMGKVYKAEQSPLGRVCALKVLSPKYDGEKNFEFHRRFLLEASTVSKLNHPNTVRIFDYGEVEEDGLYYIAMEYLAGRTLARAIKIEAPFDSARAARIASEIARSLREAHAAGVVHRDLKPGNIFLREGDGEESVKVLDFGLVKSFVSDDDLTETGMFMGSPKYMAPEQVLGHRIGPATDVYALGVLLFEMLVGRAPFDKGVGTLVAHVNDKVPAFADLGVTIHDAAIEAVVRKCLAKDPSERFASMGELLDALRPLAGGEDGDRTSVERATPLSMRYLDPIPIVEGASAITPTDAKATTEAPPSATFAGAALSHAPAPSVPESDPPFMKKRRATPIIFAVGAAGVALIVAGLVAKLGDDAPADGSAKTNAAIATAAAPANASRPSTDVRLLRVESEPAGAIVHENGRELCSTTPCQVTWLGADASARHQLVVEHVGFRVATVPIDEVEEKIAVRLEWAGESASDMYDPTDPRAAKSAAAVASAAPKLDSAATAAPVSGVLAAPSVAAAAPTAPVAAAPRGPVPFGEGMTRPAMISGASPVYTREALEARVEGTMIVRCTIDASGAVSNCRVIKGLPHMNDAVIAAMSTRRYSPVTLDGKPISVEYVFNLRLVLP